MKKKMNNKGFSLVELIIVIAIMAVLVGVLAPQFMKYVERSRKSTDVQNVASIVTAVQTYVSDPMVTTNQMVAGSYDLEIGSTAKTVPATPTTPMEAALQNAGIKSYALKSKNWGADPVKITFTVGSDGSVSAVQTAPDPTSGFDLLNGKYN